jgi:hypothetical protein
MWDLLQHFQIEGVRKQALDASAKAEQQDSRAGAVEDQVERLTLACQAMWELLSQHAGVTEDQLYAKVLEIDARDGSLDGRIAHQAVDCPHCGRKTNTSRLRCLYCGKGVKPAHSFKA